MIRDICFESCESVYADEPNDFEYLFSGDVDGDGTTETVLSALSGDILVLRGSQVIHRASGAKGSVLCGCELLDSTDGHPRPSLFQMRCDGSLAIRSFSSRVDAPIGVETREFRSFPENARCISTFRPSEAHSNLLVLTARDSCYFYKYSAITKSFDTVATIKADSAIHSIDFFTEKFMLLGLANGCVFVFEIILKVKGVERPQHRPTVCSCDMFDICDISLKSGFEPPLPALNASVPLCDCLVRAAKPSMPPSIGLCDDSVVRTDFAIAWADGRVCLCSVDKETVLSDEGEREEFQWKVVQCVHTGLFLFKLDFINMFRPRTSVFAPFPVFIATARTGHTVFLSSHVLNPDDLAFAQQQQGGEVSNQAGGQLPTTICCFEFDTLTSGRKFEAQPSSSVSSICSSLGYQPMVFLRDFIYGYNITSVDERGTPPTPAHGHGTSSAPSFSVPVSRASSFSQPGGYLSHHAPEDGSDHNMYALGEGEEEEGSIDSTDVRCGKLSLYYLTATGQVFEISAADKQLLRLGSRVYETSFDDKDLRDVGVSVMKWILDPDSIDGPHVVQMMDLFNEYFEEVTTTLRAAGVRFDQLDGVGADGKPVAHHLALYFINEIKLMPARDLEDFLREVRMLKRDILRSKRKNKT